MYRPALAPTVLTGAQLRQQRVQAGLTQTELDGCPELSADRLAPLISAPLLDLPLSLVYGSYIPYRE